MVASGAAVEAEVEIDAPGYSRQDEHGTANDQCAGPYESFMPPVAADRQLWLRVMKLTAVFFMAAPACRRLLTGLERAR
jgi:hypothetical protein